MFTEVGFGYMVRARVVISLQVIKLMANRPVQQVMKNFLNICIKSRDI